MALRKSKKEILISLSFSHWILLLFAFSFGP